MGEKVVSAQFTAGLETLGQYRDSLNSYTHKTKRISSKCGKFLQQGAQ